MGGRDYTGAERSKRFYAAKPWMKHLKKAKSRCNNPKEDSYPYYGGRGIRCELTKEEIEILWGLHAAVLMSRPSLDRIDPDKDYTLENCQFIELSENSSGRRNRQNVIEDRRGRA